MKCVVVCAVILALAGPLTAGMIPATASGFTDTTATGELNGVQWTATTSETAPFLGINLSSGRWNVAQPLPPGGLVLTASHVNGGDYQEFTFEAPVIGGYFFIENFDSSSVANITTDATVLHLSASSSSIAYQPTSSSTGVLTTSNSSYDGEGDAIFEFLGPMTTIRVDFTDGVGANGIFYGFAQDMSNGSTNPIPEPTSMTCAVLGIAGVLAIRRRRGRSSTRS